MKVWRISHPEWEMKLLITKAEGGKNIALELLAEDEDPSLLQIEEIEMTQDEYENLTEWDG